MNYKCIAVIVACPNAEEAQRLSHSLIRSRLAACVQSEEVESTYHWKGAVETDTEIRLTIKTRADLFDDVAAVVEEEISEETPEVIAVPIVQGNPAYLEWIAEETR